MIKNVLASTAPYADLWSLFKSVDHTLARILTESSSAHLTDLDRERLKELSRFLQDNALPGSSVSVHSAETILKNIRQSPRMPANFKDRIITTESFKNWQASAKTSFDKKIQKLILEIDQFANKSDAELLPKNTSSPEFSILQDIVRGFLKDIEAQII